MWERRREMPEGPCAGRCSGWREVGVSSGHARLWRTLRGLGFFPSARDWRVFNRGPAWCDSGFSEAAVCRVVCREQPAWRTGLPEAGLCWTPRGWRVGACWSQQADGSVRALNLSEKRSPHRTYQCTGWNKESWIVPWFWPEWWEEWGHIIHFTGKTTVRAGPSGEPGVDVLRLRSLLATQWELLRAHGVPTRLQI